jgi:hypothetical protein
MSIIKREDKMKKVPLNIIVISVIMIFAGLATDFFWIARLIGKAFPPTMSVPIKIYNAFALPDLILSLFLYIGAYGLLTTKKYGYTFTLVAMGMWLFDSLLVLRITGSQRLDIIIPVLIFSLYTVYYLYTRSNIIFKLMNKSD